MQVRIVCEGRTDIVLLEQVILAVFGPCEISSIRPFRDNLGKWNEDAGWRAVEKWCKERGVEGIADDMALAGIDVIVVQMDGDMCGRDGLPPTPVELCNHMKSAWMGGIPPRGLLICIPMPATDTWLAAALDPSIRESDDPMAHLVRLGILQPALPGKKVRKSGPAYASHANTLLDAAASLRSTLPELDRFMTKLEAIRG